MRLTAGDLCFLSCIHMPLLEKLRGGNYGRVRHSCNFSGIAEINDIFAIVVHLFLCHFRSKIRRVDSILHANMFSTMVDWNTCNKVLLEFGGNIMV